MIIRKPQITDLCLYPNFFEKFMHQENMDNIEYKLSDENFTGDNYCSFEAFLEPNVIFNEYNTLFEVPIVEWAKANSEPDSIKIYNAPEYISLHKYHQITYDVNNESDFYHELFEKNRNLKTLNFSKEHYEANKFIKQTVTERVGKKINTKISFMVENSNEFLINIKIDNKNLSLKKFSDRGFKMLKILNNNGKEIGYLTIK